MEINNNHKVFVLDDNYEEALPVIQALALKGISTVYWNGKVETKPEKAVDGIRFVFLDMRFSAVTDSRNIITFLFTLLRSVISMENGPYILLVWSKHDNEYLEDFKKGFKDVIGTPKPYLIINMDKNSFIETCNQKNEVYDEVATALDIGYKKEFKNEILEVLKNNNINETIKSVKIKENGLSLLLAKLDEELKEVNSLSILLMWENLVNIAANKMVNNIAAFSELDDDWDNNIKTLIQNLAVANAGKSLCEGATAREYIINALASFNQMLPDELLNQLIGKDIDEETFNFISNPSIIKTVDGNTYSISKTAKKYIIKKNNSDYTSFKHIDELKQLDDMSVCKAVYNKYLEFLGKSNFKLLCERTFSTEIKKPGGIYEVKDNELLKEVSNSIFKKQYIEVLTNIRLIKLDISSSCDYAQDKLKRTRILLGVIVEESHYSFIDNTEDIFCTPELEVHGERLKIAFNFHYIANESKANLCEENTIFSFRELLLGEIKHKLSSHMSRVGIINL
ncbi:hypothetical protein [Clostridium tagluense]|uniref:Response receiver domain-containing protein n=1 Tax=Clostridium tagluense TaxID=360422 RepID=A0A401UTX6_9CLOT|nr:hypothetical protein [Clostridium tagluense]GCD13009.1 hypothetical protein Ctaglu_46320 [Clostridium tagluense]